MVLLVPDDSDEVAEETAETPVETSGQPKAQLDDSEASRATQKVDLDLDDAPFLEDEEEEEVELEEVPEAPAPDEEPTEKKGLPAIFRNKLFYMGLVIILLLVVIAYLLFSPSDAPPPAPAPEPEPVIEEPLPELEPEPEPELPGEILLRLDPFLIEQKDEKGAIRFLEVRLVLNTTDEGLARQFKQETFTVRNALFYYLKNKDLQFLSDEKNADKLKTELLAVINQYMGFGQFETLLFEQYLVR